MSDLRLLIIDEDAKVRSSAVSILRKHDCEVEGFTDLKALGFSETATSPDIVICPIGSVEETRDFLDEKFPRKTNIQFVQLFRNQSVKAVIDAFQIKNADCLQLPFTERTLMLSVERAAERRKLIARNLRAQKRMKKARDQLERNLGILEADAQAGRQMQQSLLPRSPVVTEPYYLARRIEPSLYLSGDFVNYLTALDNFLLFYLLDVSGHGASSAFVTVMVRQLMRRIVRRHVMKKDVQALNKAPAGFLERLNKVLSDNELDKHLTMFAGALNKETNTLKYVIGAQLPAPVLIVDGKAEFLPGKGKPLGLFEDGEWEVHERKLPEKFILLAFSDGILEKIPMKSLADKEAFMLKKLAKCPADVDAALPCLGIDNVQDLPDDIAVFMLARGYHGGR
jgi:sigma-B regulation protein RsbU (phosphoserine phosphatase)